MNILHMKYAVEVARIGSINRAAEQLFIAQPNLSRCIRELEADLGIAIFDRSFKGMHLTPEGEEFIRYAQKILNEIDDVERMYRREVPLKQRFSISVPRASYISDAFARFSRCIDENPAEIFYTETNSSKAIDNILNADYRLGIIRYAACYDKYFKESLEEKGLAYEVVAEFGYGEETLRVAVVSGLANARRIIKGIQSGELHYDLVEVMACRGGCISGAGQPYISQRHRAKRGDSLYRSDKVSTIKRAQDNPLMRELYGGILKGRDHELLHVDYVKK